MKSEALEGLSYWQESLTRRKFWKLCGDMKLQILGGHFWEILYWREIVK